MSQSIFIADDNEIIRRGLRALLEKLTEWEVCGEAATGSETIEMVGALNPALILLRVRLPDMNAAEAIPKIMNVCPAVRILGLAAQGSGELAAKAVAAGASGLALTSDTESDLLLTLQSIGMNRPYFSPEAVRLLQGHLSKSGPADALPDDLTARELEILKLLASGRTNKWVARSLKISVRTIDVHRANIMRKLKLVTYSDLIQFAVRHRLIES